MRAETMYATMALVDQLQASGQVRDLRDSGDLIWLRLHSGPELMIHLFEREVTLTDLLYLLRENDARGQHTLFLFWLAMLLPPQGAARILDPWMQRFADLYGGQLYAFEVARRDAHFLPVYFVGQGARRAVHYGDSLDFRHLRTFSAPGHAPDLPGAWRIAGFLPFAESAPIIPDALAAALALLDLRADATLAQVKRRYRALARQLHPDLNPSADASQRMQQLNEAYARLLAHFANPST